MGSYDNIIGTRAAFFPFNFILVILLKNEMESLLFPFLLQPHFLEESRSFCFKGARKQKECT